MYHLLGVPERTGETYVFEGKMTVCLSVRLVISFSAGYCSICCVKNCVLVQDGAYLDE